MRGSPDAIDCTVHNRRGAPVPPPRTLAPVVAGAAGLQVRAHNERMRHRPRVHDIVTRTPDEARRAELAGRRRRYFSLMVPCVLLVLFGFFVPAPVPVRVTALAIAAVLPPIAAIRGNG